MSIKAQRPTKKQKEILSFVENFIVGHGYGPSYREIRSGMGYSSVSTVAKHIDNLIARGYLRKKDHSARSLELVSQASSLTRKKAGSKEEVDLLVGIEARLVAAENETVEDYQLNEVAVLIESLRILELKEEHERQYERLLKLTATSAVD